MDLLSTRRVDPIHQSPRARAYGFFAEGTVPTSLVLAHLVSFLFPTIFAGCPSPIPFRRRLPGHVAFAMLQVLCSRRTADRASLATSLALIGSLYLGATQGLCQLSRGHALFFRTVPPAITLVNGWVNENAFAPE